MESSDFMKKIALDLDGVVFDSENLYRIYSEIYDTDIKNSDNIVDNTEKNFQKRYKWDDEEFRKFYSEYSLLVFENAPLMVGASLVLNKLKDKFEFIIVTARNDIETSFAVSKLKEIGLDNITIFNNEHFKINRLLSEKVDYIIDDDTDICFNASSNNICSLYFKNSASRELVKNNVVTVHNWGEIYKYLILNDDII